MPGFPVIQLADGGAVHSCRLINCALTNNGISLESSSGGSGGGAYKSILLNCLLAGNSSSIPWAQGRGGGAAFSSLVNCTVVQNTGGLGGGVYGCSVTNSIVYDNSGDNHASNNFVAWSCTTPMPEGAIGNITNAPLFVDTNAWANLRLQSASPCINAGNNAYVTGLVDLDGAERIVGGTVDMGAYEWVAVPTHYVSLNSSNPTPPYVSWSTAATNIQDAVDAALAGDQVLVTNGVYRDGGRFSSRVTLDKYLILQSVNGPQFTFIDGGGTGRCVSAFHYLSRRSSFLSGLTLTNGGFLGPTGPGGGGISGGTLSNCVLIGNSGLAGGAAGSSSLVACTLTGNSSWTNGGGAYHCVLTNCTLINNRSGGDGGGAYDCLLSNCLLTNNSALSNGGGAFSEPYYTLDGCTLAGNVADNGGGAYGGALTNCTLTGNWSLAPNNLIGERGGGGASHATLSHCILESNRAVGQGGGAFGGTLIHCTLSGNRTGDRLFTPAGSGGGACNSTLKYCTLTNNSAGYGGGAAYGNLYNCLVIANSAAEANGGRGLGGGLYEANEVENCTIVGNSVNQQYSGAGVWESRLYNCIVYYNTDPFGWDNYDALFSSLLHFDHCCIWPAVAFLDPDGNITNPPQFVETNGWSNLRLQSNSPCINAGNDAYVAASTDLDGRPRILGGRVDIGAYEFVQPFNDWLQQFGLPTDGSADFTDFDSDGLNNFQESVAGTNPTNSFSLLRMLSPITDLSGIVVRWQSVSDRTYFLERASSLVTPPSFSLLASNIIGQLGTTTYTDTNAPGPFFYRVGVQQ